MSLNDFVFDLIPQVQVDVKITEITVTVGWLVWRWVKKWERAY